MNGGTIAYRYAKAFYAYADRRGVADEVYAQVRRLLSTMGKLQKFRLALENAHALTKDRRLSLLRSSVDPEPLCPEIESVYILMDMNGRVEHFRLMLLDFLTFYRQRHNIRMVKLTTAVPDAALTEKVRTLMGKECGCEANVTNVVNPEIIGGFIFESWGYRVDASVSASLEKIRRQIIDKREKYV